MRRVADLNRYQAAIRRFHERAVLTEALCRELQQSLSKPDFPLGRPEAAYWLLWKWIKVHYGDNGGVEKFELGLDDPELEEFAFDLLVELKRGTKVCNAMWMLLWCDTQLEYERDMQQLRRAVEDYWSGMS